MLSMSCPILITLHPQMKLKYFQKHRWSKAWIDMAKEIVREEFAKYKVPEVTATASVRHFYPLCILSLTSLTLYRPSQVTIEMSLTSLIFLWMGFRKAMNWTNLSQGIKKVRDPIAWWWNHQKVYPWLSAMALDYLSIPGMC